jgi:hypothetical protein
MPSLTPKSAALAVLLTVFAPIAVGQGPPPKAESKEVEQKYSGWSVAALLNERDTLAKETTDLANQIPWIEEAKSKRADRAQLAAKHKPTEEIDAEIATLLGYAGLTSAVLDDLDKPLIQRTQALSAKQKQKTAVDGELTRRLDVEAPKQMFKLEMSAAFAGLVGLVILGFFVMAYRDEQVRREIFARQVGIQFVTLFSLVIAIILFGIIDILEGKELAALLGGLSGYILGHSTGAPARKEQRATEQPPSGAQSPVAAQTQTGEHPPLEPREPVH